MTSKSYLKFGYFSKSFSKILSSSIFIKIFAAMIGKVKWFDSKKGYGFILTEEGKEIFVHYTGIIAEGFKALTEGQNVEFEVGGNEKGVQAVNVTVVPKKI